MLSLCHPSISDYLPPSLRLSVRPSVRPSVRSITLHQPSGWQAAAADGSGGGGGGEGGGEAGGKLTARPPSRRLFYISGPAPLSPLPPSPPCRLIYANLTFPNSFAYVHIKVYNPPLLHPPAVWDTAPPGSTRSPAPSGGGVQTPATATTFDLCTGAAANQLPPRRGRREEGSRRRGTDRKW